MEKKFLEMFVRNEKTRGEKKIKNNFKLTPNKTFSVTQLGEWSTYKIGIYNTKDDDGFDFMAEERRQNAQALIEELKAKYDQINKQAKEDYLSEQKEMQKIYLKKKCD